MPCLQQCEESQDPLHAAAQHLCLPGMDAAAMGTAARATLTRATAQTVPPLLPSPPLLHQDSHLHLVNMFPATLNVASTHPLQYCPMPSTSPHCPQLLLSCPACTAQPPLSSLQAACAVSAAVPEWVRQDMMLRYSSWRRSPECYQPRELIKVMSGDKETGCQSGSSAGGSEPEKLPLKSNSTEM